MSSSKTLRVGIVGLGMGKTHVPAYRKDANCEVVALCDMDKTRMQLVADELHVPQQFTDAQAMFDSGEVDVVSIATPNTLHAPLTLAALDAGLHVLCEKPMAMNAGEAERMLAAARQKHLKLAIHFNHRMNASVQYLHRHAAAGEFGDVYFARTVWHRNRGIPGRASFLDKQSSGGGALIDLGVHMLDQTLFIMGYPNVTSVSGQVYRKFDKIDVPDIPMDVEDFATAYLRLDSGATLAMEISWASHHSHPEQMIVQVYGTKGGGRRRSEDYKKDETSVYRREHDAVTASQMVRPPRNLPNVQTDLLDAIRHDREPVCSAEHGLITMRVLDALYESSETGREVLIEQTMPASA